MSDDVDETKVNERLIFKPKSYSPRVPTYPFSHNYHLKHQQKHQSSNKIAIYNSIHTSWHSIRMHLKQYNIPIKEQDIQQLSYIINQAWNQCSFPIQMSLLLCVGGIVCIIFSLPTLMIFGTFCFIIGCLSFTSIIAGNVYRFQKTKGLISYVNIQLIKEFILHRSILDIFHEIRNSRFGIIELLLSQLLPLDIAERDLIIEKLPQITQQVVNTQGLIYLTPHAFQRLVLPQNPTSNMTENELKINDSNSKLLDNEFRLGGNQLSPITGSPSVEYARHSSISSSLSKLEQSPILQSLNSVSLSSKLQPTAKVWSNDTKSKEVLLENTPKIECEEEEHKYETQEFMDIVERNMNDYHSPIQQSFDEEMNIEHVIISNTDEKQNSTLNVFQTQPSSMTFMSKVAQIFSSVSFNRSKKGIVSQLRTKPVIKAVIDTRIKEFALNIIKYIWNISPLTNVSDTHLSLICISSIVIICYYFKTCKYLRVQFLKSFQYLLMIVLGWIVVLCLIELSVRKRNIVFKKIVGGLNGWLFSSVEYQEICEKKKLYRSKSMKIYRQKSMVDGDKKNEEK